VILYAILPLMGIMMFIRAIQVVYQDVMEQRAQKQEQ
jgi:TRAP-type C4-dicarboxylate transport system permease small subunit